MSDCVEPAIRLGEWLVVAATVIGPVAAVQAQKWVERSQAKHAVKEEIFRTLMATRAARVSPEHVRALNMIDIAFYGVRRFGIHFQSSMEKAVTRAWRDYFESLNADASTFTEDQKQRMADMQLDKFMTLLGTIALAQNYDFEQVDLRRRLYSPIAHANFESQSEAARAALVQVLTGERPIKMELMNARQPNDAREG